MLCNSSAFVIWALGEEVGVVVLGTDSSDVADMDETYAAGMDLVADT